MSSILIKADGSQIEFRFLGDNDAVRQPTLGLYAQPTPSPWHKVVIPAIGEVERGWSQSSSSWLGSGPTQKLPAEIEHNLPSQVQWKLSDAFWWRFLPDN